MKKIERIILANFHTFDDAFSTAEAVAILGERIVAVGERDAILDMKSAGTVVDDLRDFTAIPGFNDAHAHMDMVGLQSVRPGLEGARSIDEVLTAIAKLARAKKPGEWIVTGPIGLPPSYFGGPSYLKEKRAPNRFELDRAAPDNPVCITPPSGYWSLPPCYTALNSAALALNGITGETTPRARGLEIEKDDSGEPTGIIIDRNFPEAALIDLLPAVPRFSEYEREESVLAAQRIYHAQGITSIYEGHGSAPLMIGLYKRLHDRGSLTMRTALVVNPLLEEWQDAETVFRDWLPYAQGRGLGDNRFRVTGVHIAFGGDPAIGKLARGDSTDISFSGYVKQFNDPERFETLCWAAAKHGLRVHVIAADWADKILPVFERIAEQYPLQGRRWVIEHLATSSKKIVRRVQKLGLDVTVIPTFHLWKVAERYLKLSEEEQDYIVPVRQMLDAGIPVAGGTDAIPCNPMMNAWSLVTRRDRVTSRPVGKHGSLSVPEAIKVMTTAGARLTFEEDCKGPLVPGNLADIAFLSRDPLRVDVDELPDIKCEATLSGGEFVYGNVSRDTPELRDSI